MFAVGSFQLTWHVLDLHDLIVESGVNVLLIGGAGLELGRALSTPGNASSPFASAINLFAPFGKFVHGIWDFAIAHVYSD